MAVRTHDSKWRLLVAGAPLLGVAFIVLAALQGEPEVAKSRTVMEILAGVAALGGLVAWWTAYQLRAAPAVPVALAQAGQVALRGRAQALPGAAPLTSPDGVACLWFKHSQQAMHQYNASDSVRPFLLVDDTGQCIVLPAGADVTGSSRQLPQSDVKQLPEVKDITGTGTGGYGTGERLLREGDDIHVVGWFTPASAEAMDLQMQAARLIAQTELPRVLMHSNDPAAFQRPRVAGPSPLPAATPPSAPVALPVIGQPEGAAPFVISIASRDGQAGLYGFLAAVDALVLCAAAGNYGWLAR